MDDKANIGVVLICVICLAPVVTFAAGLTIGWMRGKQSQPANLSAQPKKKSGLPSWLKAWLDDHNLLVKD